MTAEPIVKKRCAACGRLIDNRTLICPYCDDDRDLTHQPAKTSGSMSSGEETEGALRLKVQVSNAVNLRRITIALVLAVIVFGGTLTIGLLVSLPVMESETELNLLKLWAGFAALAMVVGVALIIFDRRLTERSSPVLEEIADDLE